MIIAWLATKHDKGRVIAPAFAEVLEWEVREVSVDTDQWGTFTPEIPRTLSPREAAMAKARYAIEVTGGHIGLGSEGTVGPHPAFSLVTAVTEHVAIIDVTTGMEVVHHYTSSDVVAFHAVWRADTEIAEVVRLADLPHHAVIARAVGHGDSAVKGIRDADELRGVVDRLERTYPGRQIVVESDFRAMMSPSRQKVIGQCAQELVARLSQSCPSCGAAYWGFVDVVRGVVCGGCGGLNPTVVAADVMGCWRCDVSEVRDRGVHEADPAHCDACNP